MKYILKNIQVLLHQIINWFHSEPFKQTNQLVYKYADKKSEEIIHATEREGLRRI